MEKQKKQMLFMLILVVLMLAAYLEIRFLNQKQGEKEAAKEAAETIRVTENKATAITEFSYLIDGERLSFTKQGNEWTYDGDAAIDIDENKFETLLEKAVDITAEEEITEYENLSEYGLEEPANVIVFATKDEETIICVGNKNEITGQYYLKTDKCDTVYVVESSMANGFDMTIEQLRAEAEETEDIETTETE